MLRFRGYNPVLSILCLAFHLTLGTLGVLAEEYHIRSADEIQSTLDKLRGGDTLYIAGGDYYPRPVNAPWDHLTMRDRQGRPDGWITIRNEPGSRPRIFLGMNGGFYGLQLANVSYVRVEGLELVATQEDSGTTGLAASGHHIQIVNNIVHGFKGNCIGPSGSQLLVENNTVYDCAKTMSNWGPSGISIYHPRMNSTDNTDFAGNLGNPANRYAIIIRNNIVHDSVQVNSGTGNSGLVTDGNGIICDDFHGTQGNHGAFQGRTLIANNLLFNNGGRGIALYESSHIDVFNNTFYRNKRRLDGEGEFESTGDDNRFMNNIVFANDGVRGSVTNGGVTLFSNNLWFNDTGHTEGIGDISGRDPLFSRLMTDGSGDFRLQSSSPAIGAGRRDLDVMYDLQGLSRGQFDLGAYAAGPSQATSPAPSEDIIDLSSVCSSGYTFGTSSNEILRYQTFSVSSDRELKNITVKVRANASGESSIFASLFEARGDTPIGTALARSTASSSSISSHFTSLNIPLSFPRLIGGKTYAVVLGQEQPGAGYEWCTGSSGAAFGKGNGMTWVDESRLGRGWLQLSVRPSTSAGGTPRAPRKVPHTGSVVPTIDGKISGDRGWGGALTLPLNQVTRGTASGGASVRLKYNDTHLFIVFKVEDSNGTFDRGTWYENDGVEVFLDPTNAKASSTGQGNFQYFFSASKGVLLEANGKPSAGVSWKSRKIKTGYVVEAAIPWSTLNITSGTRSKIGIDFTSIDNPTGAGINKRAWAMPRDDGWRNPSILGTVELGPVARR